MDHSDPAIRLVRNLRLTTKAHNIRVINHARGHARQRIREHFGIRIDAECQLIFVRAYTGAAPNRVEELILKRGHPLIKHGLLEEAHKHQLRIAFASVPALGVVLLERVADFSDEDHGHLLLLGGFDRVGIVVVKPSVHLGHVVPLVAVCDSDVRVRLDSVDGDHEVFHHAQHNVGRVRVVTRSLDHAISDDKDKFMAIRVVGRGERVEGRAETLDRLGVRSDETDGVCKWEVERHPVRWRLRDHIVQRERARRGLLVAGQRRRAPSSSVRWGESPPTIHTRDGALAIFRTRICRHRPPLHLIAIGRKRPRTILQPIPTRKPRSVREKSALLISLLLHVGSIPPGGRAVNIIGPLLNLLSAAPSRSVRLISEVAKAPGEEPAEENGHEEADGNNPNDKHKRNVEHDVRRNTADRLGVDKSDADRFLQAIEQLALICTLYVHRNVLAVVRAIWLGELVEYGRVGDLRAVEPVQ